MLEILEIPVEQCWPIRHEVMWPNRDLDYVKLADDQKGLHLGLFLDQKLISVVSLFIRGNEAQFRKFATLHSEQGKGYGSQLLTYLLSHIDPSSVKRIYCNARLEKAGFYERFGLVKTQDFFQKGGQDYVVMEKFFEKTR